MKLGKKKNQEEGFDHLIAPNIDYSCSMGLVNKKTGKRISSQNPLSRTLDLADLSSQRNNNHDKDRKNTGKTVLQARCSSQSRSNPAKILAQTSSVIKAVHNPHRTSKQRQNLFQSLTSSFQPQSKPTETILEQLKTNCDFEGLSLFVAQRRASLERVLKKHTNLKERNNLIRSSADQLKQLREEILSKENTNSALERKLCYLQNKESRYNEELKNVGFNWQSIDPDKKKFIDEFEEIELKLGKIHEKRKILESQGPEMMIQRLIKASKNMESHLELYRVELISNREFLIDELNSLLD